MNVKELAKWVIPPAFLELAVRLRSKVRKTQFTWQYLPEGWAYARQHPEVRGWNVEEVLEVYKSKWPKFVEMVGGTGPLGIAHESDLSVQTDVYSHNAIMSYAYTLALVAHSLDRLSMLDWGGGIGHYYLFARTLLPNVGIEYHCKDVPLLAEYGAHLFPEQHFYSDESCLERTYELVMAGTSMHYTEDWQKLLLGLARATGRYLYIANLPVVLRASSFVFVQRPYVCGYNTEYLAWCLNRDEFLSQAEASGLKLVREFVYGHAPFIQAAPEQNQYRGYLFSPAAGKSR